MIEQFQALYSKPARRRFSVKQQAAYLVADDRAGNPHQMGLQIAAMVAMPPAPPAVPEVGTIATEQEKAVA